MRGRTRYQGGALLGFLAVAILLAGLLVGGLYFVQRYNKTANAPEIVATDTQSSDDKNTSGFEQPSTDTSDTKTTPVKPDTTTDDINTTNNEAPVSSESHVATELPTTGPTETVLQLMATAALTYASISYLRSRRSLDFQR